jgi:acetyl esterase/lipase
MSAGVAAWLLVLAAGAARADTAPAYTRTRDVVYGRKFALALTMDVFAPPKEKSNGIGLIAVVSGGWFSRPEMIQPAFYQEFLGRGYTVFAVLHGSQPKFTVPEIVEDVHRAVRFVRHHARDYGIDPDRIGIYGASAGGHLALMMGTAGRDGRLLALDPVERESSRVQAVAAFFPPTDFLNFGEKGRELIDRDLRPPFTAAVDYHEYDREKALYVPVTDKEKLRAISRQISPAAHVTARAAPAFLMHGDQDRLVPLQQSEEMLSKLKDAGVPAELVVKKGAGHGWPTLLDDLKAFADWFDKHLAKKGGAQGK